MDGLEPGLEHGIFRVLLGFHDGLGLGSEQGLELWSRLGVSN